MPLRHDLERELKTALLGGNKQRAEVIKSIKNALQYEAVAKKVAIDDLSDELIMNVMIRESKKRKEACELYENAGEIERAKKEAIEKTIIEEFLPAKIDEEELIAAVNAEIAKLPSPSIKDMGRIIGTVKEKYGAQVDGATLARITKVKLGN